MELGLKIKDAVKLNKELQKYAFYKNGRVRIDFKNKEALYLYNKTILKHLFGLNMEFHKNALIPTPINRYLFVKNVFDNKDNKCNIDNNNNNHPIKTVLEIGTGSGIISIMIAKYYNCKVYATETVKEYINIANENIIKNNLNDCIKVIDSNNKIIEGIDEFTNEKFDLIISYPPFYDPNSVPSKRSFGGAHATDVELIGGGNYGEEFSLKIIEEGVNYLNKGGLIALMFPHKPMERRKAVEHKIKDMGLILKTDEIKTGKRIRHIIKGYKI
ncbi:RlmF-related methyltransferase [Methanothermococcus sp.]|uniref:RlmF-related methyltransferase n=1 Tax=Methanothermococcus sp. TaxID=2614238 RepID=UPI0025F6B223|nr:RlmF-related methyltransferase [Methanothermococcus sp.]